MTKPSTPAKPKSTDGFTQVPNIILEENDLSPVARLVFMKYLQLDFKVKGERKGIAWPTQGGMATAFGVERKLVGRAVAELEECGLLVREGYLEGGVHVMRIVRDDLESLVPKSRNRLSQIGTSAVVPIWDTKEQQTNSKEKEQNQEERRGESASRLSVVQPPPSATAPASGALS